ncbi:MAG TPA: NAD-dependent epimerase/dehydratase family protein [Flavisolibacter sp.]|nr:NAD-dependent epimerase/dehydratase family protein [Flavisolibacter sp.]
MKRIFITGATGYIGHQLALTAAARGYLVSALVRNMQSPNLPTHPSIHLVKGDVQVYETVVKAMTDCEYVLHAAGLAQLWHKDRSLFYRTHVTGTRNVLEAARFHGVEKLVFTSSCAVLGPSESRPLAEDDPRFTPFENDYEISKHCAEELVKEYVRRGLPAVIVALPRVYGPGLATKGNPVSQFIRKTLRRGFAFVPSAKNIVGNYVYIDDVVNGHFDALEKGENGEKYILGGENISYQQLFETVAKASEKNLKIIAVPVALLKLWSALVFSLNYLTGRHTHLSPKVVKRLLQNRAVTSEKAVRQLNYQITPFAQGIEQTIHHLNNLHHG